MTHSKPNNLRVGDCIMTAATLPAVGDTYNFTEVVALDHCTRPGKASDSVCNWTCWLCHGTNTGRGSVTHLEVVASVQHFADNSIEIVSVSGRRATAIAPHGDVC